MMIQKQVLILGGFFITTIGFQNCSKVSFTPTPTAAETVLPNSIASTVPPANASPANGVISGGLTNNGGLELPSSTAVSLKAFKPVLAVGGVNCMACHGVVSSSIVTDFGISSGNFVSTANFLGGGNRTAFNNVDYGGVGGWGTLTVNGGSIFIPKMTLSSDQAKAMTGVSQVMSLADMLKLQTGSHSMIDHVTPAAGADPVVEYSNIGISYPKSAEILALLPPAMAIRNAAVSVVSVANLPASSMLGFMLDSSGKFVRNSPGVVRCFGDVVVKGVLFLKNLTVQTNDAGCRLYVSQSVFIQGPINYVGSNGAHLQITSARSIIMGISAERMGASAPGAATVRFENGSLTTAGGPWARFLPSNDSAYSPVNTKVNGIDRGLFFDQIVLDAQLLGSELQDAGDPAATATANLIPGETISNEENSDENAHIGGDRLSINYSHLLLNAPHVHSRYAGTFQGTIVADVAMLARNPSTQQLEQFTFDPLFENVTEILPALTTDILTFSK